MKIRAIHTSEAGPLGTQTLSFEDDWNGQCADNILLSGPNGCGKSSVLRAIAALWSAFGHWMHTRTPLSDSSPEYKLLARWKGIAITLEDTYFCDSPITLLFGEFGVPRRSLVISENTIGEEYTIYHQAFDHRSELYLPKNLQWFDQWTASRQKMLLSYEPATSPNVIFLDAEERRWVPPTQGLGEIRPDNLQQRWLARYQVSDQWEGQLEASLITMKAAAPERFFALIQDMNGFLMGKEILPDITLGENRLKVKLASSGKTHGMDELSAGEHQVLIQLFIIGRWLEKGGVVLIDEPDLYLHPSLIPSFLGRLEQMVADRQGQLIITSHVPDVWSRYEARGKRILLGANP